MTTKKALTVALCALSAQISEGKHYQAQEHANAETRAYWGRQVAEAEAAYVVLVDMLKRMENKEGEA